MNRRLSKVLRDIYTSGNEYTVLTLLDKLIDAVEKYEVEATAIYRHEIHVYDSEGVFSCWTVFYSGKSVLSEAEIRNAFSNFASGSAVASDTTYPAIRVTFSYVQVTEKFTPKVHIVKPTGVTIVSGANNDYQFEDTVTNIINEQEEE